MTAQFLNFIPCQMGQCFISPFLGIGWNLAHDLTLVPNGLVQNFSCMPAIIFKLQGLQFLLWVYRRNALKFLPVILKGLCSPTLCISVMIVASHFIQWLKKLHFLSKSNSSLTMWYLNSIKKVKWLIFKPLWIYDGVYG